MPIYLTAEPYDFALSHSCLSLTVKASPSLLISLGVFGPSGLQLLSADYRGANTLDDLGEGGGTQPLLHTRSSQIFRLSSNNTELPYLTIEGLEHKGKYVEKGFLYVFERKNARALEVQVWALRSKKRVFKGSWTLGEALRGQLEQGPWGVRNCHSHLVGRCSVGSCASWGEKGRKQFIRINLDSRKLKCHVQQAINF